MATNKPTKPEKATETTKSPAKAMQELSEAPPHDEQKLPVTLRVENSYEYHLDLVQRVVEGILDPDTPDAFIEVPCTVPNTKRFLHTSYVKEIDVRGM